MGRVVVAAYMPKPGREAELLAVVRRHFDVLRAEGLVTDRAPYVLRAASGALIEVFEWRSADAIRQAHGNAAVQAQWAEFDAACEYTPLAQLAEAQQLFAEFEPVTTL